MRGLASWSLSASRILSEPPGKCVSVMTVTWKGGELVTAQSVRVLSAQNKDIVACACVFSQFWHGLNWLDTAGRRRHCTCCSCGHPHFHPSVGPIYPRYVPGLVFCVLGLGWKSKAPPPKLGSGPCPPSVCACTRAVEDGPQNTKHCFHLRHGCGDPLLSLSSAKRSVMKLSRSSAPAKSMSLTAVAKSRSMYGHMWTKWRRGSLSNTVGRTNTARTWPVWDAWATKRQDPGQLNARIAQKTQINYQPLTTVGSERKAPHSVLFRLAVGVAPSAELFGVVEFGFKTAEIVDA